MRETVDVRLITQRPQIRTDSLALAGSSAERDLSLASGTAPGSTSATSGAAAGLTASAPSCGAESNRCGRFTELEQVGVKQSQVSAGSPVICKAAVGGVLDAIVVVLDGGVGCVHSHADTCSPPPAPGQEATSMADWEAWAASAG
jgi:hypothetical protein